MKRQWTEKEISNFLGIATAKAQPQLNECVECKNLDLRENTGELVVRSGYSQKYAAPTNARLTNISYLAFTNFFVPDIGYDTTTEEGGREVTVQVAKATLNAESGSSVTVSKNILAFFIRPFWKVLTGGNQIAASSTSTLIKVASFTATANQYKNCYLRITATTAVPSSRNSGHFVKILSHTTGTNTTIDFTIETLPYTPLSAAGNEFEIWGWDDNWHWLNEMIITKIIDTLILAEPQRMELYFSYADENQYYQWTIYNYKKDEFSWITYDTASLGMEICITDYNNTWDVDDEVILGRNWIPLQYLEQMYYCTAEDIVSHKVLNDLRIGFGGQKDRLGVSIGFRNKNFQITMAGTHPTIAGEFNPAVLGGVAKIILDPYNATADEEWISASATSDVDGSYTNFPDKKYFYKIGVLLDDQSWNIVAEGDVTTSSDNRISLTLKLLNGLFNKRLTYFGVFLSEGESTSSTEATNPFFLIVTRASTNEYDDSIISLPEPDYDEPYWAFDGDGYSSRTIYLRYDDFTNNQGEISDVIGFTPTLIYAKSWDDALVTDSKVFVASPYSDLRWENKIFFSPISGDGVFQHDTLIGSKYQDFSNVFNNGNEVIGLGLLANLDIGVLKKNSFEKRDAETGVSYYSGIGLGSSARRSIVRAGEMLHWASERDVYAHNGRELINLSEATIRDSYRALTSNQRNAIIAVGEEKDHAYRMLAGDYEWLLTKRGWVKQERQHDPTCYAVARDGSLWFMSSAGVIYSESSSLFQDAGTNISFQWKSVPIDVALLGESMADFEQFFVSKVWVRYESNFNLTMNIYRNGSGSAYQSKTFNAGTNGYGVMRVKPGFSARQFQFELTGTATTIAVTQVGMRIKSFGIIFSPIKVGIYSPSKYTTIT